MSSLAVEVYEELGSGFKEDTLQQGLAIAFRQARIKYLRETHLEIFYKKDMGILARGGFSFDLSKRVLNLESDEFNKLLKIV